MNVWDIAHGTSQNTGDFEIHVGNFLDEFYRSPAEVRIEIIEREPEAHPNLRPHMLPFLAGMVHKLCNDYELVTPDWVHDERYVLSEPYFPLQAQGKLRQLLLEESPPEFRQRNIFTSANCLTRV